VQHVWTMQVLATRRLSLAIVVLVACGARSELGTGGAQSDAASLLDARRRHHARRSRRRSHARHALVRKLGVGHRSRRHQRLLDHQPIPSERATWLRDEVCRRRMWWRSNDPRHRAAGCRWRVDVRNHRSEFDERILGVERRWRQRDDVCQERLWTQRSSRRTSRTSEAWL